MTKAKVIDGKAFASELTKHIAGAVAEYTKAGHEPPGLAVVLVGENPASQVYVKNKINTTKEAGMRSIEHRLSENTNEADLLKLIADLNADDSVDGILVQLPLPPQINEEAVLAAINPDKDVDGFHAVNVGRLSLGLDALIPCTPYGCLLLLEEHFKGALAGKSAVVVGRSNIVGKPMAQLLLGAHCTVTIAHSKSQDLQGICREADIVIAAVGRPQMLTGEFIKEGAVVIDVGINRIEQDGKSKIVGDVDFVSAAEKASAITPVPGGVGPMTIACLLRNTLIAAARRRGVATPTAIG